MTPAEILERLQSLQGPDTDVDADIWCEIFAPDAVAIDPGVRFPPYTASLDAAIALVEKMLPGAKWTVSKVGFAQITLDKKTRISSDDGQDINYANPAIALLIALFRALPAKKDEPL